MKEPKDELKNLISRLMIYQSAVKMSDNRWCARYGNWVGTTRTWRQRMCEGKLEELLPEKWLPKLRELIAIIEGGSVLETFYADLPFFKRLARGVELLEGQTNDRRCLVVLAENGTGKTVGARRLVSEEPAHRSYASALTPWRDNKTAIISGLCAALGCRPSTPGAAAGMESLIASLRVTARTLFLDEAHQGGVVLMRVIKDLINETPSRFVYLALRTEFDRVRGATSGSIVEAKQFLGRCMKPINDQWADGVSQSDVRAYLKSALDTNESWSAAAAQCSDLVRRNYNLRLLADAVEDAKAEASESDKPVDTSMLLNSVQILAGITNPKPA